MTSSEPRTPNYRRRILWLAAFTVVLFGGYSVGWYYMAGKLRSEADKTLASLNRNGVVAECANLAVGGFPFRLGVTCDSLGYSDPAREVIATAGSLRTAAQIYQPLLTVAELNGPLRADAPGIGPLWVDWDSLRSSVRLSYPLPERISLEAEGLSAQTDPDEGEPQGLFSAGQSEAHLRPNGDNLDYAGSFTDLEIDPGAIGGRTLPPLDGSVDATLNDGVALIKSKARSLRGQSAEIRQMDLSSDTANISVTGKIAVDESGLVNADLKIKLRNPNAVAAILATAIPEASREIQQGFAALAMLGSEPTMPLRIVAGKATLGFIPLGKIKPLAF